MFNLCDNDLIKFTYVSFKIAEKSLPFYSCEKSKQEYTQHQLMALSYLMMRLRLVLSYFHFNHSFNTKNTSINLFKDVPHYTTFQKFFERIGSDFIGKVMDLTTESFGIKDPWVAFRLEHGHSMLPSKPNNKGSYIIGKVILITINIYFIEKTIYKFI